MASTFNDILVNDIDSVEMIRTANGTAYLVDAYDTIEYDIPTLQIIFSIKLTDHSTGSKVTRSEQFLESAIESIVLKN